VKNSEDFINTLDILGQVEGQPHHFLHQGADPRDFESPRLEFDKENMRLFHNVLTPLSSASTGSSMNKG
jgi:hypothetical protein